MLGESTTPSVFWSGGAEAQQAAQDFAIANGGATLDMTAGGQAAEAAAQGMDYGTARPIFARASEEFARNATGEVHVFLRGTAAETSIWEAVEKPALEANQSVTRIIVHALGQ
jgi:hypothetical protein